MKKYSVLLLTGVLLAIAISGCGTKKETNETTETKETVADSSSKKDTMVIGISSLDEIFNPLFNSTACDAQVNDMIFTSICRLNEEGELIDWAGHLDTQELTAKDGHTQVKYTVTLNKDMTFTDGEPITIDDVIFYYYVVSDPTYDGPSTFSTLDIVGMKEYYYDSPNYAQMMDEINQKYSPSTITKEEFVSYLIATNCEGWFDGELEGNADEDETWAEYLAKEGYDASKIKTPDTMLLMLAGCEYERHANKYDPLTYYMKLAVQGNLADGIDVDSISGIERIDDYSCTILCDSPNISGTKLVAWQPIIPKHYYGKEWMKGDLSSIKALNHSPVGSGPYIFKSYKNSCVSMEKNPTYFMGEPKISNLKFQVVDEEDKVDKVLNGEIDITEPTASLEVIEKIDESNEIEKSIVDNPGYGYIGINAERVPDIYVRKALMYVMKRESAISSYYGELGTLIERPLTPTLAEYPKNAKEYYGYDTHKALKYFKKAGYKQVDGKLVKEDGEPLIINVSIADAKTHPATPILMQMADDMEKMGAELIIHDVEGTVLNTMVQNGETDMWVMAWGNFLDCDLTQIFGSRGGSNFQHYYNDDVDIIQSEIVKTLDFDERCKLVSKELDMIMSAAVYMPVYQCKKLQIYNATSVNISTLPENTTIYWNYSAQIENLELN